LTAAGAGQAAGKKPQKPAEVRVASGQQLAGSAITARVGFGGKFSKANSFNSP
jgi:hypothetical protein